MPVNVVRTPEEEIAWKRAKARARVEYPDATGERFYRIVMAIYKKIAHYQPHSSSATDKAASARECDDQSTYSKLEFHGSQSDYPQQWAASFSDASICDRCGVVHTGKTWRHAVDGHVATASGKTKAQRETSYA